MSKKKRDDLTNIASHLTCWWVHTLFILTFGIVFYGYYTIKITVFRELRHAILVLTTYI